MRGTFWRDEEWGALAFQLMEKFAANILSQLGSFGVPGIAIGVFLLVIWRFQWAKSKISDRWTGPIAALIIVSCLSVVVLSFFISPPTSSAVKEQSSKEERLSRPDRAVHIFELGYELYALGLGGVADKSMVANYKQEAERSIGLRLRASGMTFPLSWSEVTSPDGYARVRSELPTDFDRTCLKSGMLVAAAFSIGLVAATHSEDDHWRNLAQEKAKEISGDLEVALASIGQGPPENILFENIMPTKGEGVDSFSRRFDVFKANISAKIRNSAK